MNDSDTGRRESADVITNAMTVDVEDYFQVSAFEGHIRREDWDTLPCRVEANTDRILALFDRRGARATFFVLGWVAKRYPALIRRIVEAGHELGSHGMQHVRITQQTPAEFRVDAEQTRKLLQDISGSPVVGYRAASFSIGRDNLWALDILKEIGHGYSSSIYPVHHDLYGMPEASRFPFRHEGSGLLEIPVTTVPLAGQNLPCGGGGYFRLLPYRYFRWAYGRVNGVERKPAIFYFHPWEVDPEQPRQQGLSLKTRFRHYTNLSRMEGRLDRLLGDFRWGRMDEVFLGAGAASSTAGP